MPRWSLIATLPALFAVVLHKPAVSQSSPTGTAKPEVKKEEKDPKTVDYEKAVKDLKRIDGTFPMYQRRKEILLELSEAQLGKLFLIQATIASGANDQDLQAGAPINDVDVFSWERMDDQVYLMKPNLKYRWNPDSPLAIASQRSFPKAMLGSYRIEQQDPARKLLLVNVTNLFMGDIFRLTELVGTALSGPYMLDREKTSVSKIKGFGDNTVLSMKMHFSSPRGSGAGGDGPLAALLGLSKSQMEDDRSVPLEVSYNMWYRKDTGYRPRFADPRVGYFSTDFFSVDKFFDDDQTQRLIVRWNLKKKNPAAALSEPVKPIIWTLDPSIPKKWRPAVREGILRWNKAFEALGYKDAVQVQEVDDDPDYDHADGRYNVVRFPMSEDAGYAVALARVDPISGEILNAAVNFDMTMLSFAMSEQKKVAVPAAAAIVKRSQEALVRTDETASMPADRYIYDLDEVRAERVQAEALRKFGWKRQECCYGHDLALDAQFAYTAMAATGFRISPEDYAKQFISDVVCHEVGHNMGLRHNFVASTNLTTAQLADDTITNRQAIAASVMEYTPANIQAILKGSGNVYGPTIGTYDIWAIKFGYMEVPTATSPLGEVWATSKVAAESGKPGHAYLSDEDADDYDPYAVRFDCAKDPLNYSAKNMEAARKTLHYALTQLPRVGESYDSRTEAVMLSLSRMFREGRFSTRFIGGLSTTRNFRGDAGEKPQLAPVSPTEQRAALRLITGSLLRQDSFLLPREAYRRLVLGKQENSWTAPLRSFISSQQIALAGTLMSATKTNAIAENAYKTGPGGAYTLAEHYATLLGAVFSEIGSGQNVGDNRRDLQRFVLNGLMLQASAPTGSVNEDVRMIASDSLHRLRARFADQLATSGKLDEMTRMHLRDAKATLDRFESRTVTGIR